MKPNKPLFFHLPLGKAEQQSQGTHLAAVLLCRMNFKKRRTDKQGWLTKPTTLKQLNNSFSLYSLRKTVITFCDATTGFPAKWRQWGTNEAEISYWCQLCHCPDMGSTFDWLKRIFLEARSIRSPSQFSGSTAEAFLMDTVTLYKLVSYQNCPQQATCGYFGN